MNTIPLPQIFTISEEGKYAANFIIEPFYPGYGTTVGNALRRVLLSTLEGCAISALKIKGASHEFSTIPGVKEDIIDIILNLKKVVVKVDDFVIPEGMRMQLDVQGEKVVTAGDFTAPTGVTIMNPDYPLMTFTTPSARVEMEVLLSRGRGYEPVENREHEERELGLIAIDSFFSPIEKVGFSVEDVRVGKMTNFDRIKLFVQTNGVLTPLEAVQKSLSILIEQLNHVLGMTESRGAVKESSLSQEEEISEGELKEAPPEVVPEAQSISEAEEEPQEEKPKKRGRKKKEE